MIYCKTCSVAVLAVIVNLTCCHGEDISRSERITWEREMGSRVEDALVNILGADKAKVIVKADLEIKQTQKQSLDYKLKPQQTTGPTGSPAGSEDSFNWLWPDLGKSESEDENYLLPGLKVYGKSSSSQGTGIHSPIQGKQTSEQTTILPKITVNKLSATVIVDTRITGEKLDAIKRLARTILEIDATRGDSLEVIRLPFISAWGKIRHSPQMLLESAKWAGGMGTVVLLGFSLFFGLNRIGRAITQAAVVGQNNTRQIDMNLTARAHAALGVIPMPMQPATAIEGAANQGALAASSTQPLMLESKHFLFINGTKPEHIAKVLENEDTITIALVLSSLDAQKSNDVFNFLPKEKQADIAIAMAKTDFVDTEQIRSVEKKLKKRFDSLVEGKEHTIEILSRADSHTREAILASIKDKNPELYNELQEQIFKFEDLSSLAPEEIALVLGGMTHEEISVALRGMPAEFVNSALGSLPKETQKALRQWITITKPQPAAKIEQIRGKIADRARNLEHEGRILRHMKPDEAKAFGEVV